MISLLLLAATSAGLAPVQTSTLQCGRGAFTATSQRWARPSPIAPYKQSIFVDVEGKRQKVDLEPTRLVSKDSKRVRSRFVLSWTCTTSDSGAKFVSLGYSCAIDRGYPNDCGGEQEWFRLLDDRGRAVDRGVPVNGPARTRLDDRLGLSKVFEAGVQMQSLFE